MTATPRLFEGGEVIVVAGGPSLRGFDFSRLAGRATIAINRAYEVLPTATVLWWSDPGFWRRHRDALKAHPAPWKMTGLRESEARDLPPTVTRVTFTGLRGYDPEPGRLRHGNNSSYACIHLAAKLGARRIVLLGVDMDHGENGETHWHDGHGYPHQRRSLTEKMLPYFADLAGPLKALSVEVVNGSLRSNLTLWPRTSIDEALALPPLSVSSG